MSKPKKSSFRDKVQSDAKRQQSQSGASYGYLRLPKNVSVFTVEPGRLKFDIIPYIVSDPKHPSLDRESGIAEVGSQWYRRPFKVHKNVGSDEESYVCLTSFGKKCPICDYMKKAAKEGASKEELAQYKPKNRSLYIVIPKDNKDFEEVPHIFDFSDFLFQDQLNKDLEEDDEYDFCDLEIGKTLQVTFTKDTYNGNAFSKATRVKFLERDDQYDSDYSENVPDLDKVLIELSYEELEAKFLELDDAGTSKSSKNKKDDDNDDEDLEVIEDPKPRAKKSASKKKDEDDEEEKPSRTKKSIKQDDEDEDKPTKKASTKKKDPEPEPEEEEDEITWEDLENLSESKCIKLIEDKELDVDPDDYEDSLADLRKAIAKELDIEVPKKKSSTPAKKKDEEEEEEKAPKSKKSTAKSDSKNDCPHGYVFGVDTDKKKECGRCKAWDACEDLREANAKKKK